MCDRYVYMVSDTTPCYEESVKLADSLILQLKKTINEKY